MPRFSRKALALGTAAAIATASSAFAGPIGPSGTQVKQAVPSAATDVRIRRGAAIAAGVAIGVGAAAIAASSYNYGYGYAQPYGYAEPYGYEGDYGPYQGGYAPSYGYGYGYGPPRGYNGYCQNSGSPERSTC
jgi:hypothetical protein